MAKSMNLALAQYNEAMARLKNARVDLECAEAGVRKALAELAKYGIVPSVKLRTIRKRAGCTGAGSV